MIIPYKVFKDGERLPFVTLTLRGPKKQSLLEAFVDSGADFSILHGGWMRYLGFSKKMALARSIQVGDGDSIQAFQVDVAVSFYGWSFRAPITFSDSLGPGFNLLGRNGFFNRFRFCFDDKHFVLSVNPLK